MEELIRSLANMLYESGCEPEETESKAKSWVIDNISPNMYLVVNNKHPNYADRWKIFKSREKAIQHAEKLGMEGNFLGFSDKVGTASTYMAGDIEIYFIPLEVQR